LATVGLLRPIDQILAIRNTRMHAALNSKRTNRMDRVMAFVLYLFVLLIAAGSVLFGLDLVTSPLSSTPNVPIGRSVRHVASTSEASNKLARREIRKTPEATRKQPDDRTLSPVYPASPGPSTPVVARNTPDEPVPRERAIEQASVANDTQPQREEDMSTNSSAEAPQPAASCDVQACNASYRTFTPADCTYQPLEGPRRLCTKSATAQTAARSRQGAGLPLSLTPKRTARASPRRPEVRWVARETPRRRGLFTQNDDDRSETARIVLQMTRGHPMGDIVVQRADGSIIVVHTGNARAQAYR
jgi:hypothetical protein